MRGAARPACRLRPWPLHRPLKAFAALLAASALAHGAFAQAQAQPGPDAGSLLRQSQQPLRGLPELPKVKPPAPMQDTGVKVTVQRFEVDGSSRFLPGEFEKLFADLIGKELGFGEMRVAADRVAAFYRQHGLVAHAFLPEQGLADGIVHVQVTEAVFGKLHIEKARGEHRLPTGLVRAMLERGQQHGQMLDADALERQTLIANEVPGVRVSTLLRPGSQPGETDIVARVDRRPVLSAFVTTDNEDGRATGELKGGAGVNLAGVFGAGESAQVMANASKGKTYISANVDVPLGASGLRGSVSASAMNYKLVGDFAASGAKGSAQTVGAALSHSLYRSTGANLYARASFDHRHMVNDSAAGSLSDKSTDSVTVSLNGDTSDTAGGGGANVGGISITGGRLDLSGNAADLAADAAGPARQGRYAKVLVNAGRLQRVSERGSIWLGGSAQWASKNLDSSEKFSLGGSHGVRAYPAMEGSGDSGALVTAEYRWRVADSLQLSAFYDYGRVTREQRTSASSAQPNTVALQGAGVGVEWHLGSALLRGTVATRIGHNPMAGSSGLDSDGTRRNVRAWFTASIPFST